MRQLDYNLGISIAVYTDWYFRVGALCMKSSVQRMRPLDMQAARALEISSALFQARMQTRDRPHSDPMPETPAQAGGGGITPRSRVVLS